MSSLRGWSLSRHQSWRSWSQSWSWTLPSSSSSPPSPPQMAMFGSSDWSVSQGVSIPPVPPLPGHDVWWSDQMTSTWLDYHNLKYSRKQTPSSFFYQSVILQQIQTITRKTSSSVIKQNLEYSVCKQHSSTAACMRPTEARPVSFNWNV